MSTKVEGVKGNTIYYTLETEFVAVFSYIGEKNMDTEQFAKCNAPAIMFPYIREHISLITQKAGVNTIYIAPINFVAYFKQNEQSNCSENEIKA